jgi:hypothetical protein
MLVTALHSKPELIFSHDCLQVVDEHIADHLVLPWQLCGAAFTSAVNVLPVKPVHVASEFVAFQVLPVFSQEAFDVALPPLHLFGRTAAVYLHMDVPAFPTTSGVYWQAWPVPVALSFTKLHALLSAKFFTLAHAAKSFATELPAFFGT